MGLFNLSKFDLEDYIKLFYSPGSRLNELSGILRLHIYISDGL